MTAPSAPKRRVRTSAPLPCCGFFSTIRLCPLHLAAPSHGSRDVARQRRLEVASPRRPRRPSFGRPSNAIAGRIRTSKPRTMKVWPHGLFLAGAVSGVFLPSDALRGILFQGCGCASQDTVVHRNEKHSSLLCSGTAASDAFLNEKKNYMQRCHNSGVCCRCTSSGGGFKQSPVNAPVL